MLKLWLLIPKMPLECSTCKTVDDGFVKNTDKLKSTESYYFLFITEKSCTIYAMLSATCANRLTKREKKTHPTTCLYFL